MTTELYAILNLLITNIFIFLINVIGEWISCKNKLIVKETALDYGLVLLGVAESAFVILICVFFE